MISRGIEFRPYRDGDEHAINEAFNEVFGLGRPISEWHWKYGAEPAGRRMMLAVDTSGRVLAQYAAVAMPMQANGVLLRAGQIVDVFSRPDSRHGLAAGRAYLGAADAFISRWCHPDGLAVCFGFPSERPLRLGISRLGYAAVEPQPVPVWTRPTSGRGRVFTRHTVRLGFDAAATESLWYRSRDRYPIAVVRDSVWLDRRYNGRTGVGYVYMAAYRRGVARAIAVIRPAVPVASWVELVWDGEDVRALAALDRAASSVARRGGAERLQMWLAGDEHAAQAFTDLGWSSAEHPMIRQVVHPFHPAVPADSVPGRVYLTMGDSDLV